MTITVSNDTIYKYKKRQSIRKMMKIKHLKNEQKVYPDENY